MSSQTVQSRSWSLAYPRSDDSDKLGPWGTDRGTERRYGYPPPRRSVLDGFDELEDRVRELELDMWRHRRIGRTERDSSVKCRPTRRSAFPLPSRSSMSVDPDYDWSQHYFGSSDDQQPTPPDGTVRLSDVKRELVRWLWQGRIPLGKITIIQGDPGLGKSTISLDLGARVSRGLPMPDGTFGIGPAGVLILSAEDGLSDTVRPRLEAAGADLDRVRAQTWVARPDKPPVIPSDLDAIAASIRKYDVALTIIDPMMAFLGADVGSNNNQDIRRALAPVKAMAEELGVAVVFVHHLNKGSGPAIYRGGGSIGISAAARCVLVVGKNTMCRPTTSTLRSYSRRSRTTLRDTTSPSRSGWWTPPSVPPWCVGAAPQATPAEDLVAGRLPRTEASPRTTERRPGFPRRPPSGGSDGGQGCA